jgi:hypothetical protein
MPTLRRLLTNVMLYWLTGTAGSSASIHYDDKHAGLVRNADVTPANCLNAFKKWDWSK